MIENHPSDPSLIELPSEFFHVKNYLEERISIIDSEYYNKMKIISDYIISKPSTQESNLFYAKLNAKIKWPNDVHYNGKKLCGILTEGIFGKENYVVVGIGLNINQSKFPDDIKDIATSLKIIKKQKINIKKLSKNIIDNLFSIYNNQYDKNNMKNILKIWKKYCDTIGKNVIVISRSGKAQGKAIGVDKGCNLLLKLKNSKIIKITEGDVRVRY